MVSTVSGYALHFAFVDPYNLEALDFRVISTLSRLKRIDLLIHLSAMDLQRNLSVNLADMISAFDVFAPGWREKVSTTGTQQEIRRRVVEYWRGLIANLGVRQLPSNGLLRAKRINRYIGYCSPPGINCRTSFGKPQPISKARETVLTGGLHRWICIRGAPRNSRLFAFLWRLTPSAPQPPHCLRRMQSLPRLPALSRWRPTLPAWDGHDALTPPHNHPVNVSQVEFTDILEQRFN